MGTPLFYEYSAHYDRGDGLEKDSGIRAGMDTGLTLMDFNGVKHGPPWKLQTCHCCQSSE